MRYKTALVFYYYKDNKYAFNSLAGSIDQDEYFNTLDIFFIKTKDDLIIKLKDITNNYEKIILGISFFTPQMWEIKELIFTIKQAYDSKIFCIAGGAHPSGDSENVLKMGFDFVAIGEGELTIREILKKIDNDESIFDIEGIAFFLNNKFYKNKRKSFINLNDYYPFTLKYGKAGPFELSRGCLNKCNYCQTPRLFNSSLQYRTVDKVAFIIKEIVKIGYKDVRFVTSDAFNYCPSNDKNKITEDIENLFINVKKSLNPDGRIFYGNFPSEIRPESINEKIIELIKKYCSNETLLIGAQSGSDRLLGLCNRNHTVKDIYKAVKIVLKNNLKVNIDLIFGLPDENEKDRLDTIKLINDMIELGVKIHAHVFIPLPDTPFWTKEAGVVYEDIKNIFNKLFYKGLIYGKWKKQEALGEKISEYLKKPAVF